MIPGNLRDMTEATIRGFEVDARPESSSLDFKRIEPPKTDEGRSEFLKDVAAFANKDGGDLVYGVATKNDVASKIMPLKVEPADALKRRLATWLDADVEPRVACEMREVPLQAGGYVLAIRVPASLAGPHWYRVHGTGIPSHYKFAIRSGTGTTDMDYEQVRNAFDRTSTLIDRARQFREDRAAAIEQGRTIVPMGNGPTCVLHVVPLFGQGRPAIIDIAEAYRGGHDWKLPSWSNPQPRVNLDGLLLTLVGGRDNPHPGYIQLFRTGAVEVAQIGDAQWHKEKKLIPSAVVSRFYRSALKVLTARLRDFGVSGPTLVGASFAHVGGYRFATEAFAEPNDRSQPDRAHLQLPDQLIADVGAITDVDEIAKPMLDVLWQAFGEIACNMYGPDGAFVDNWPVE